MSAAYEIEPIHLTFEEYLVSEHEAEERHEFVNGEVIAMAGASDAHELVAMNVAAAIHGHIRGKGCRVFKGDMKLRFQAGESIDLAYYPDVMVTCDPADDHAHYKLRPKLVVEVMTRFKQDHFEKLFIYQQIESLEEYLVIGQDPEEPQAWVYRRDLEWKMPKAITEGDIHLPSIDLTLPLGEMYRA